MIAAFRVLRNQPPIRLLLVMRITNTFDKSLKMLRISLGTTQSPLPIGPVSLCQLVCVATEAIGLSLREDGLHLT
jgi:hypothetical protein